jgi:hypothetical protein
MLKHKTLAAAALALAATASPAAVLTHSTAFVGDARYEGTVEGSFGATLRAVSLMSLPRFDATLGTLTGVQIGFDTRYDAFLQLTANDTRVESDFTPLPPFITGERNDSLVGATLAAAFQLSLFDPAGGSGRRSLSLDGGCGVRLSGDEAYDSTACTDFQLQNGSFAGSLALGALALSQFIGFDPINLSAFIDGRLSGVCDSDDGGDICTVREALLGWTGTVQVTYTYDTPPPGGGGTGGGEGGTGGGGTGGGTVPEPATGVLTATALAALALRRRAASRPPGTAPKPAA